MSLRRPPHYALSNTLRIGRAYWRLTAYAVCARLTLNHRLVEFGRAPAARHMSSSVQQPLISPSRISGMASNHLGEVSQLSGRRQQRPVAVRDRKFCGGLVGSPSPVSASYPPKDFTMITYFLASRCIFPSLGGNLHVGQPQVKWPLERTVWQHATKRLGERRDLASALIQLMVVFSCLLWVAGKTGAILCTGDSAGAWHSYTTRDRRPDSLTTL